MPPSLTADAPAATGAAPIRAALADRLIGGRPPQFVGRILLLLCAAVAVLAHVPGLALTAVVASVVITILAAVWTRGPVGYAWVAVAMLVQLPLPVTPVGIAGAVGGAALAVVASRLIRSLQSLVSEAQATTLRHYGARDELDRQSRAQQAELTGQISYWASHDRLTEVFNRTALVKHLSDLADARSATGVLVVALAGFSTINEELGADVGDELLAALARRLHTRARDTDLVARLGGDEFAMVLPGLTAEYASQVAHRVLEVLADPFTVGPHVVPLHARCGLALDDGAFVGGASELLRQASSAARSAGVDGPAAVFSASTRAEAQTALTLENDLRLALERDELFLLYQPLVSTVTGRIESVEALVRWQHPERGLVPPDAFIGAAERTGQIVAIGIRVLEMAVAQVKQWSGGLAASVTVAVNVSARQLAEPDFVEQVRQIVWGAGIDPHQILLELTESLLVEDSETAIGALWQLRGLGFRIALDDFGTGYSSLARLGELPLDELKIDKSFVDRLGVTPSDSTALVTAAIAMGHGLGLTVVAEGVETQLQATQLVGMGCDLLQGYLLGKPQSGEVLTPQMGQRLLPDPATIPEQRDEVAPELSFAIPQLMPDSVRR